MVCTHVEEEQFKNFGVALAELPSLSGFLSNFLLKTFVFKKKNSYTCLIFVYFVVRDAVLH